MMNSYPYKKKKKRHLNHRSAEPCYASVHLFRQLKIFILRKNNYESVREIKSHGYCGYGVHDLF